MRDAAARGPRAMARPALLVALLAAAVHLPAIDGGFVSDDTGYALRHPATSSLRELPRVFTMSSHQHVGFAGHFRPVAALSWGLDKLTWAGGEGTPPTWPFHATNLLVHALCAALLLLLLHRHLGAELAIPASLLWAVHPVHVETAAWISARSESLAMLFCLAALLALDIRSRPARIVAVALATWAACGSKETAFLLPAAVAVACVAGRWPEGAPWDGLATSGAALALFLAQRTVMLESAPPINYLHPGMSFFPGRVGLALRLVAVYGRLLVWPWPLTIEYQWPGDLPPGWLAVVGVAILAACGGLLAAPRSRPLGLALAATFALLAPVLHLNKLGESAAERFLYMPSAPFCVAAAMALAAIRKRSALSAGALLAGLVVLGASLSARQSLVWRDEVSVFENALAHAPRSPWARESLAGAYQRAGRIDLAAVLWDALVRDGQATPAVRYNLALARYNAGRPVEGLEALGARRSFRPGSRERRLLEALLRAAAGQRGAPGGQPPD